MYTKTTKSISISVVPAPILDQSDPDQSIYSFSYNIKIENLGEETVQLLERHWIISSAGKLFDEVVGDGVVGMQPILEQGDKFEYTSAAVIEDPVGDMKGSYTMRSSSGQFFEVEIPEFNLVFPTALH